MSWLLTLERKGLIVNVDDNWFITEDGKDLYKQIEGEIQTEIKIATKIADISALHVSLQNHLQQRKKKKNVLGFGNVYFIPSVKDLEVFLNRFRKNYPKLWDIDKIEKCLIRHMDNCIKRDVFAPAIKYYIIKESTGSQLASALESFEDTDDKETQFEIKQTKDLFE